MLNYLLLLIGVFAVSTAPIFAFLANAPGVTASFWRFIISGVIMAIFYKKIGFRKKVLRYSLVSGLALSIHMASWIQSLFQASIALSTAIVCTHSIFSGIFASLKGEKISLREVFGIFIAIAGIYLMSGADFYAKSEGIMLALIGAVAGGLYFSFAKFSQSVDFREYVVSTYILAGLFSALFSIVLSTDLINYPAETYLYFILLALIPMSVGHTVLNYLIRRMKVVAVTGSVLGEAVGSAILAAILLNQTLSAEAYFYMMLILAGIYLVVSKK